jgi:spore coat polysaccharide biosynthesis protein SpsF
MSSIRLPGKVLKPICGEPMMLRQLERLVRCRRLDEIIVATSIAVSDDPIADVCRRAGVRVARGSLDDVLDRYHSAAHAIAGSAQIVRLTADCPLADWRVIDACVELHLDRGADYTSNSVKRSFPKGLDVEVMTIAALDAAWRDAKDLYDREHVTPFLYRNPQRFDLVFLLDPTDRSSWRWTVDTPEDFRMVEAVYEALFPTDPGFTSEAIEAFLMSRPDIARLNAALG